MESYRKKGTPASRGGPFFYHILGPFTIFLQENGAKPEISTKYPGPIVYAGNCQEALAISRQSLSAIMAINSELVGLPRVLWMV